MSARPQRVAILGSTGSIGEQTLQVIRQHPDRVEVAALVAGSNREKLKKQHFDFPRAKIALFAANSELASGLDAVCDIVASPDVDIVVVAVAGVIGLVPTIAAIEAGKMIALASKEVLVAAGELVMPLIKKHGCRMTPIDSEHSAVFQCLQGVSQERIDEIILTASGGPFFGLRREQLEKVSVEQALKHPTWTMGGKITVDSATLMNKALELIEAHWLFDVPMDRLSFVVHRQSIVHSMVRFTDGSVLAQMGWPNMQLPIQYALLYPDRPESGLRTWNPVESGALTFEDPDLKSFRGPNLARLAVKAGGTMPCVFNAANEAAAGAFLRRETSFLAIQDDVERVMQNHKAETVSLESLLECDRWAREEYSRIRLAHANN